MDAFLIFLAILFFLIIPLIFICKFCVLSSDVTSLKEKNEKLKMDMEWLLKCLPPDISEKFYAPKPKASYTKGQQKEAPTLLPGIKEAPHPTIHQSASLYTPQPSITDVPAIDVSKDTSTVESLKVATTTELSDQSKKNTDSLVAYNIQTETRPLQATPEFVPHSNAECNDILTNKENTNPTSDPHRDQDSIGTDKASPSHLVKTTLNTHSPLISSQKEDARTENGIFYGQKLTTWIAAAAAILAIFFFIKYTIDKGLITPAVRMILSFLFGIGTIIGGMYLHGKPKVANSKMISQALMGIGICTLYFAGYAISKLYGFTPTWVSFIIMCIVTTYTVIISIKYKESPMAIIGLMGGLLTPGLLSNHNTHTALYFSLYTLVIGMAFLLVAKQLKSLLLIILLALGIYGWTITWMLSNYNPNDSVWLMSLMIILSLATFKLFPEKDNPNHKFMILIALIMNSLFAMFFLLKTDYGVMEWAILGLLLIGTTFLTLKDSASYWSLYLFTSIFSFILWLKYRGDYMNIVFLIFSAITILPFYIAILWKKNKEFISYLCGCILILSISYMLRESMSDRLAYIGLGVAVFTWAPILFFNREKEELRRSSGELLISGLIILNIALAWLIDISYWTIPLCVETLLLALLCKRTSIEYTKVLAVIFGVGALISTFPVASIVFPVTLLSVLDFPQYERSYFDLQFFCTYLATPLIACGFLYTRLSHALYKKIVLSISAYLLVGLIYALYFTGKMEALGIGKTGLNYAEICTLTNIFFLSFAGSFLFKPSPIYTGLLALGFWRLVAIQIIGTAPIFSELNPSILMILYSFGVPTLCSIFYSTKSSHEIKTFFSWASATLSFILVSLIATKYLYDSIDLTTIHFTQTGIVTYSIVWLLLGCAWLTWAFHNEKMVIPAFILIYAVVCKVFLLDVSSLDGLIRVLSLFALAGILFGISFFYTKFFSKRKTPSVSIIEPSKSDTEQN